MFWIQIASHFVLVKLNHLHQEFQDCWIRIEMNMMLGKYTDSGTGLEQLVRDPLGAEALEASYFTRPAHVE